MWSVSGRENSRARHTLAQFDHVFMVIVVNADVHTQEISSFRKLLTEPPRRSVGTKLDFRKKCPLYTLPQPNERKMV